MPLDCIENKWNSVLQKMQNPDSLMDYLWFMVRWSISFLGSSSINNLLRPCNQSKNDQNGQSGVRILLRQNGRLISVHLWNRLSTFIPNHFLQNLKNPLVAKWTIYGDCRKESNRKKRNRKKETGKKVTGKKVAKNRKKRNRKKSNRTKRNRKKVTGKKVTENWKKGNRKKRNS